MLAGHNVRVQNIFQRILKERGIDVRLEAEVLGVSTEERTNTNTNSNSKNGERRRKLKLAKLKLSSNLSSNNYDTSSTQTQSQTQPILSFDDCLWCTSAGAASWLSRSTPFETDEGGFLMTDNYLQCIGHRGIFAVGDCATMRHHPRPKAGVFAVRAGPPLLRNIMAHLTSHGRMHAYKPQCSFLSLISTGDRCAVASRGDWIAFEGPFLWTLKDCIDRRWMRMYQDLPDMMNGKQQQQQQVKVPASISSRGSEVAAAFAASAMRCGGCGAKVGASTLTRVLAAVHQRAKNLAADHDHELPPPLPLEHDDAAVIPIAEDQAGGSMIHTIDFFRSFTSDPFVFGKIAAVHALSDCHAMGAAPQTALALAVVPYAATESITESTLISMLSGASDVLVQEQHGCQLVGGHTCEGAELALGFAIHGFIHKDQTVLHKRGCRVGDRLILTKPIGTGALFAADMRARCRAVCVEEALQSMARSNGVASRAAMEMNRNTAAGSPVVVHACTDVTGFGLMGHLLEMLVANDDDAAVNDVNGNGVGCRLNLNDIPFLQGAVEAAAAGIFSSLQPQNVKNARHQVSNHDEAIRIDPVRYPLLFDPQTAGGLLFSVDCAHAERFVELLLAEGVPVVADIGEVVAYEYDGDDDGAEGVCSRTSRKRVLIDKLMCFNNE